MVCHDAIDKHAARVNEMVIETCLFNTHGNRAKHKQIYVTKFFKALKTEHY